MSNEFCGDGNLGDVPKMKMVKVDSEQMAVLEFRVAFDNYQRTGGGKDGGDAEYEEKGSFWLSCSLWGKRAERASKLLAKGCRVHVKGKLNLASWTDKETGEQREAMQLAADDVFLSTVRLESVQFKAKSKEREAETA